MIAPLVAALVAAALPQGETRYRFELGGERIGTAELRIRCDGPRCAVRWSVSTRSPEAAGGAIHSRRVEVETDVEGRWVDGPVSIHDDGVPSPGRGVWGAVPVALAEVVLARAREEAGPCIEIFDERSGARAKACGRRGSGATWELDVAGEPERVRVGVGGLPAEVLLPGQGARYVADPRADNARSAGCDAATRPVLSMTGSTGIIQVGGPDAKSYLDVTVEDIEFRPTTTGVASFSRGDVTIRRCKFSSGQRGG